MKKTDLDFGHQERPWSFCIEANFSILRLKKIDQKGPELDIKQQFYTKSTPQNPMSWSVFPDHEVGRSFKLIFKITIDIQTQGTTEITDPINECELGIHQCSENAACQDLKVP